MIETWERGVISVGFKRNIGYLVEILKAVGRIVAAISLLNVKLAFWLLRLGFIVLILGASYQVLKRPQTWMVAPAACILVGAALIVWTHRITGLPGTKRKVITTGPFAIVRHPMYSGWCLAALSLACLAGHWLFWILAILQTGFMLSVSCGEDEENIQVFGEPYESYSRQVWLTGIGVGLIRLGNRKFRNYSLKKKNGESQCIP